MLIIMYTYYDLISGFPSQPLPIEIRQSCDCFDTATILLLVSTLPNLHDRSNSLLTRFCCQFATTVFHILHWAAQDNKMRVLCAVLQPAVRDIQIQYGMMTSSNGNIFCVTCPLCGKFTGYRCKRSVTRNFEVFFDLLNKRSSKQS